MIALLMSLSLAEVTTGPAIEVQGHRGARGVRNENTLVAFEYALEIGVDTLELDLVATKDDHLVVFHDLVVNPEICRKGGRKHHEETAVIRKMTLKQVKAFDCGSYPNPRFPKQKLKKGERMPTFEDVLKLVVTSKLPKAKTVELNVEMKGVPALPERTPPPKKFAQMIIKLLKKYNMVSRTVIQSFDGENLQAVKDEESKVRTSLLTYANRVPYVPMVKSIGADILSPYYPWITKTDVEDLHKAGIKVIPWTANDRRSWEYLLHLGVDGIISDYPEELSKFLKEKGKR